MSSESPRAGRPRSSLLLRIVFGLAAIGLTVQWFDRLGRMLAGELTRWQLAWHLIALGFLPFGVVYFAYRAVVSERRDAEPDAAPDRRGM